jgi:hypothetical protein
MNRPNLFILLPLLSFFWLVSGVFTAGFLYPGYSHLAQFMSVLGATGTEHGAWVNLIVFAGAEIWVILFVVVALRAVSGRPLVVAGLILLGLYAVLLMIAAVFPCDFECRPEAPSLSHLVHAAAGLLAYLSGLCGLYLVSLGLKRADSVKVQVRLAAALFVVGVGLLSGMVLSQDFAGLFQRLLETLLYVWMVLTGIALSHVQANDRLPTRLPQS